MSYEPWLSLCLATDIGPATAKRLLEHFGSAEELASARRRDLIGCGLTEKSAHELDSPDPARLDRALNWLLADNHHLITWDDARYPILLKETGQEPIALFVAGDPDLLALPQLAIVGSRNATPGGKEIAGDFAAHLSRAGLVVTSGLATGIDAAAHRGALDNAGKTIAVLGTGPDIVYPEANRDLAVKIAAGGGLVSEFPPGMPASKDHFPRRNRIISGLSLGVLVVEAGVRSGSLITARIASEFGREVFAVPGSIHSPVSKGCHRLIKQGAKLVENSADIVTELAALTGAIETVETVVRTTPEANEHKDSDYGKLLRSMGYEPVDIQTLVNRCGLTAGELSSMLLILELEGRIESLSGGRFQQLTGWTKRNE